MLMSLESRRVRFSRSITMLPALPAEALSFVGPDPPW
jgi:hypothetical protein